MSIAKPFTFVANTYAKASEVNADFDTVYSQVNTNISDIAQNATDIDNLDLNKANLNGSSSNRFAVADPVANADAVNKQSLMKAINNSLDYISGFVITKDSGSPNDTIIVSAGSCYNSTKAIVLKLTTSVTKQNQNQAANGIYYVYVIGNSTGSVVDVLISTSSVTPALPSGYTTFRQIGKYTTDSDAHIAKVSYYGDGANSDKNVKNFISYSGSLPDTSSGITIDISGASTTNSNFDVPEDGYIQIQMTVNNGADVVYIDDKAIFAWSSTFGVNAYVGYSVPIPITKGTHTYRVSYTASRLTGITFFPMKGDD